MSTTMNRGGRSSQSRGRERSSEPYRHDPSDRARYPDRRTLTGEAGVKPGVPKGENHGMSAVLVACHGAKFPMTKEDIIDQFGDQEVEWYKGQVETMEDIMDDVEQDDFLNMADLVHAIGDVVQSYTDDRNERYGRNINRSSSSSRTSRSKPNYNGEEGFDRGSSINEDIQDISESEWNEFQEWKRSQETRSTNRSRSSDPNNRSQNRRIQERGDAGEGGYDEEIGDLPPMTRTGHVDRRTRQGREMEDRSSRRSRSDS